jgi:hypothetical protein
LGGAAAASAGPKVLPVARLAPQATRM